MLLLYLICPHARSWLVDEVYDGHRDYIDALLMAVWRREPKQAVTVYSDQGNQCKSVQNRHSLLNFRLRY